MLRLALLPLALCLMGCALLDASPATRALPTPRSINQVSVDLYLAIADSDTEEPVVAESVWVNDELAHHNVSGCILMLYGDYPATQDGYEIRIKAKGYNLWTTRVRPRTNRPHSLTLRVHLQRAKPQSNSKSLTHRQALIFAGAAHATS